MSGLGAVGLEKLAARGQVVKQILDLNPRALGRTDLPGADLRLLVLGAQPQAIFEQAVGRLRNGQRESL